jgi:hypothetical protein
MYKDFSTVLHYFCMSIIICFGIYIYLDNLNLYFYPIIQSQNGLDSISGKVVNLYTEEKYEKEKNSLRSVSTHYVNVQNLFFQINNKNIWFNKNYKAIEGDPSYAYDILNNGIILENLKNKIEKASTTEVFYSKNFFDQEINEIYGLVLDGNVLIDKKKEVESVQFGFKMFLIIFPILLGILYSFYFVYSRLKL